MQASQIDEKYAGGRTIISLSSHPASVEVASVEITKVDTKFGKDTSVAIITDKDGVEFSVFGAQPIGVLKSQSFNELLSNAEDGLVTIFFGEGVANSGNPQLQASFLDTFN